MLVKIIVCHIPSQAEMTQRFASLGTCTIFCFSDVVVNSTAGNAVCDIYFESGRSVLLSVIAPPSPLPLGSCNVCDAGVL